MQKWRLKNIGDVLKLEYGKPLSEGDRDDNGAYPAFGANGVKCRTNKYYFDKPSIIVGRKGSAGEITLTDGPFWPLDVTYFVKLDPANYDLTFMYHCLKSLDLPRLATGVKPGINRNNVYDLQFPFPPLHEQKRIVAILDEAFEGVERAAANAEKNLNNSDDLLRSYLISATTGKLSKKWREKNPTKELVSEELQKTLVECKVGRGKKTKFREPKFIHRVNKIEIPDTWTWASPEQLSTHIVDCPHTTPKWTTSGVVCLRTTNFLPGRLNLDTRRFVSEATYNERIARLEPQPGDVLYSREGGILGIACVFPPDLKACLGQRMMLFRLDGSVVRPQYFAAVLNSPLILSEVNALVGGAAAPHLNIRDIRTFPIPLPPIGEQHSITEELTELSNARDRLTANYRRKVTTIAELKQSILRKAFAGELTAQPEHVLKEAVS